VPFRTTSLVIALLTSVAGAGRPALGQTPIVGGPLPAEAEAAALKLLNAPSTLRFPGGARAPSGTTVTGDVAVLGGSLELGGQVTGQLLVVNGDLVLVEGSQVAGDILVIGGVVQGEATAQLSGDVTIYSAPLRYRVDGRRVQAVSRDGVRSGVLSSDLGFGEARVSIRAGPAYNRVEGLPVRFGGIVRTRGANPLSLEAQGIWRSVSGLDLETARLGHWFRLTQALGGRGTTAIGATAHDEIVAIEDRGVSGLEASLATFLLHEDMRDYYRRRGWSAFATFRPGRPPIELTVTYRDEDHLTAPLRSPWTLKGQSDTWRPLPTVGEGRIHSVETRIRWDSRDDPTFPADGWLVELSGTRQVGGSLQLPPTLPADSDPDVNPFGPPVQLDPFMVGTVDVRRYARVGPTSRLSLRAFGAGSLRREPVAPQAQIALGGEGSLPGHPRFSLDCGARLAPRLARTGEGSSGRAIEPVYPGYGCDRLVLFQAEFQGALPFSRNPLPDGWEDSELGPLLEIRPIWSVFLNAGQGWALGTHDDGIGRVHSPTRADVGLGLFLGPVGVYWSYPLNRQDRGLNFFVRFQQRF